MDFKKKYSAEELNDLIAWFEANKQRLPQSLQLDPGNYIPDLKSTLEVMICVSQRTRNNPTFSGFICNLFKVRDKIIAENLLKEA